MVPGKMIWVMGIYLTAGMVNAESTLDARHHGARGPRFWWRAGAVYRAGMEGSATGTSRTQQQAADMIRSGTRGARSGIGIPPAIGPNPDDIGQYKDRDFDDGYVHRDSMTYDPGTGIGDEWTVNWGYEESGQYDPNAGTITFRRASVSEQAVGVEDRHTSRSVRTDRDAGMAAERRFGAAGMELAFGTRLTRRPVVNAGFALGLRYFPEMSASLTDTTFRQTVTDRAFTTRRTLRILDQVADTYTYDYPDQPLYPDPPPAPYDGSNADPANDPLLDYRPARSERQVQRSSHRSRETRKTGETVWNAANRIDVAITTDLLQAIAGPRGTYQLGRRTRAHAAVALALNHVDTSVDRREIFEATGEDGSRQVLRGWHDRERRTDWLWGGRLEAGATVALGASWNAGISAGYEWIERVRVDVGPNRITLDLSGPEVAAFIGMTF